MAVWDTSVASRLHPEHSLFQRAEESALAGQPYLIAAPTAHEIAFGLQRRADDDPRFVQAVDWFTELLALGVLGTLPLNRDAALLAGHLRAQIPAPPTSGSASTGRRRGPKPERRVAWVADLHIAATAWIAGEDLCTADQEHFNAISNAIAALFPKEGRLKVLPAPG